eukprot:TRINITY_DN184_c0_g1_i14.p2 TRINITY_DN184_c0_g1~~TRINITY_DN184_c0_g1_i14.p2  ORF type:complete len:202 (-),score=51.82 TRINITY_DN184_c0_g1_i14:138-743(-)
MCIRDSAYTFVDECHATGFLGETGRGTPQLFGVEKEVDFISSTLGKALGGGSGGYITSRKEVVDYLRQKARPYLFSNSIAPAIVGASLKVFDIIDNQPQLIQQLNTNTKVFREGMQKAGFKILGNQACPIVPVYIGDAKLAGELAEELLQEGIYVIAFSYPVVPKGQARIRVQISAAHKPADLEKAITGFTNVARKKGIIQ